MQWVFIEIHRVFVSDHDLWIENFQLMKLTGIFEQASNRPILVSVNKGGTYWDLQLIGFCMGFVVMLWNALLMRYKSVCEWVRFVTRQFSSCETHRCFGTGVELFNIGRTTQTRYLLLSTLDGLLYGSCFSVVRLMVVEIQDDFEMWVFNKEKFLHKSFTSFSTGIELS